VTGKEILNLMQAMKEGKTKTRWKRRGIRNVGEESRRVFEGHLHLTRNRGSFLRISPSSTVKAWRDLGEIFDARRISSK